jgi:bacterioferritin (cytochrome b1)
MKKLAEANRDKVIDLLSERLTFERASVKLYDAIIAKMQRSNDDNVMRMYDEMKRNRDEEKEHEEWLEEQIRALGGDTRAQTEMSRLAHIETEGIERVVLDGDNVVAHLFHALLSAELSDNAGWDLLVQIADDVGDREAKRAFKKRLHQEEDHLIFVRRAVERFARMAVTGRRAELPHDTGLIGRVLG